MFQRLNLTESAVKFCHIPPVCAGLSLTIRRVRGRLDGGGAGGGGDELAGATAAGPVCRALQHALPRPRALQHTGGRPARREDRRLGEGAD